MKVEMVRELPAVASRLMLLDRWLHRVIFLRPTDSERGWRRPRAWLRGVYDATFTFHAWRVVPAAESPTDTALSVQAAEGEGK